MGDWLEKINNQISDRRWSVGNSCNRMDAFCRRRYVLLEGSRKLRHWLVVILASCVDNFWYYM